MSEPKDPHGNNEIPSDILRLIQEGNLQILEIRPNVNTESTIAIRGSESTLIPFSLVQDQEMKMPESVVDKLVYCAQSLNMHVEDIYLGFHNQHPQQPLFLLRGGNEFDEIEAREMQHDASQRIFHFKALIGSLAIPDNQKVFLLIGEWVEYTNPEGDRGSTTDIF